MRHDFDPQRAPIYKMQQQDGDIIIELEHVGTLFDDENKVLLV